MNVALYGLVIYGVGCIIPTPLDQAMQETNARPVFVTDKVLPAFGPLGPLSQTQAVTLSLVAFGLHRSCRGGGALNQGRDGCA